MRAHLVTQLDVDAVLVELPQDVDLRREVVAPVPRHVSTGILQPRARIVDFESVLEHGAAGPAHDIAGLGVDGDVAASTRTAVRGVAVRAEELGHLLVSPCAARRPETGARGGEGSSAS